LFLDGDHMDHNLIGRFQHFNLHGSWNIGDTQGLVDSEIAHVHVDTLGNVAGQTLDLDLTDDQLENSTIYFDASRFADDVNRHRHADRHVHTDSIEVCV